MRKVLVYGLGVTGISAVKTLSSLGYELFTYDKNKENIKQLEGYDYSPISDERAINENFDFVLKSPGIKPSDDFLKEIGKKNEIISDIELSYRLFPEKNTIAITGTNGKTTTTSMITHILNESGIDAVAVGNIGEGILWQMYQKDCVFVEEVSSFQLHNTKEYDSHIVTILNISEDHTDWHGSFDAYIDAKFKIARNQSSNDFVIINHEDEISQRNKAKFKGQVYEFSTNSKVERGMYLSGDKIIFADNGEEEEFLSAKDLLIVGRHNVENAMVSLLVCILYGVDKESLIKNAKTFNAIEHRLEFVTNIKGVDFYNDSKATNVDSAIKAINSFENNIILIAGGYDKKIDYSPLIKEVKDKAKAMILIGETKKELENLANKEGIKSYLCQDMKEAVNKAFEIMEKNDTVLLSPASASWDMYKSYADRGNDFKEEIRKHEMESL